MSISQSERVFNRQEEVDVDRDELVTKGEELPSIEAEFLKCTRYVPSSNQTKILSQQHPQNLCMKKTKDKKEQTQKEENSVGFWIENSKKRTKKTDGLNKTTKAKSIPLWRKKRFPPRQTEFMNKRRKQQQNQGLGFKKRKIISTPLTSRNTTWLSLLIVSIFFSYCDSKMEITITNERVKIGDNVTLACTNDNQTIKAVSWLNETKDVIAIGKDSANEKKYFLNILNISNPFTYQLTIKNFSQVDFGVYICQMGFEEKTKLLSYTDSKFFYELSRADYDINLTDANQAINVSITFAKIYPVPKCGIKIQKKSLEDMAILTVNKMRYSYTVTLHATLLKSRECTEAISVICSDSKGRPLINVPQTFDDTCNLEVSSDSRVSLIAVLSPLCLVLFIVTAFCCWKRRRKANSGNKRCHENGEEKIPMQQP